MALSKCPECGGAVSSAAPTCPHCGYPIAREGQAAGAPLTTIQVTSKRLKIHTILSSILTIFGFIMFVGMLPAAQKYARCGSAKGTIASQAW